MKKNLKIIMAFLMGICIFPMDIFALQQDVSIKVKGSVSIQAVTTISSDITIDMEERSTSDAYIELQNKSTIPLNVKITDIESLSAGAPSDFVDTDTFLGDAGVEDTQSKIGFAISKNEDINDKVAILPDTEIDLGVVSRAPYYQGEGGPEEFTKNLDNNGPITYSVYEPYYKDYVMQESTTGKVFESYSMGREIYRLDVNNGYAWTNPDTSFYYGITMVVSPAQTSYDRNPVPELGIDGINLALLRSTSLVPTYVEVYMDGLTEENANLFSSYGLQFSYQGIDGKDKIRSAKYIGKHINRELAYNEDTEEMEEVENGEVYGISYIFEVNLDEADFELLTKKEPLYINIDLSMETSNSQTVNVKDILATANLN